MTDATDEDMDALRPGIEQQIKSMDAKTRQAKIAGARESMIQYARETMGNNKAKLFRETMFGPVDIVFVVLAIASAYKVATFGGEASA
jgi:hypothetical protein